MQFVLLLPIVLPIVAGILVWVLKLQDKTKRQLFVGGAVVLNMLLTAAVLLGMQGQRLPLFQVAPGFAFELAVDPLSVVFGLMVSVLWVLTTFYAFGYMGHEGNELRFFTFFTIAMGISTGLALAGNALTMYLFYELLTFITYPLVTHAGTPESIKAGRKYLVYSIAGATLGLVSTAFLSAFAAGGTGGVGFTLGGILSPEVINQSAGMLQLAYLVGFLGFAVKSAVFPLHGWLPSAYVAPTPVTALLHAVAVVKAGVFGIMRLTYYGYGPNLLRGSWVQMLCMCMVLFTILFGSTMALRTTHLKKRLAYSTISQLSYILFCVMLLSESGLQAGLIYMVFHAVIKITLFFCCGNIMFTLGTTDVREMGGYGKKMPYTFACFTIAGLAMAGVPPSAGFFAKFYLAMAAFTSSQPILGAIGAVVVMASVLLTVLYLMPMSLKAFFAPKGQALQDATRSEAPRVMLLPVAILSVAIVLLGLVPGIVTNFILKV